MVNSQLKKLLRPIYSRSRFLQQAVEFLRLRMLTAQAQAIAAPFMGDVILTTTIEMLLQQDNIKYFVETGTYLGHTTYYLGGRYPALQIATIENNVDFYKASHTILNQLANVQQHLGDSVKVLNQLLLNDLRDVRNETVLFFLDAHWYEYLPLPDEIQLINKNLSRAIMVIHDFQIPERDDYGFDVCNGQTIGLPMLLSSLTSGQHYDIFVPNYRYEDVHKSPPNANQKLRGYALVFQNA